MTAVFEVPDLDAIDSAEDLEEVARVFVLLSRYAVLSAKAVRASEEGRIQPVREITTVDLPEIHAELPAWARWY